MESDLKCECQMIFASILMLNNHKLICPIIRINLSKNNHNPSPARMAYPVFIQSPAANPIQINQNEFPLIKIKRCIMDSNIIKQANQSIYENVCSNEICITEYNLKCKKTLRCGHECLGSIKDKCLNCLNSNCIEYKNYFDQNSSSLCPICLTDTLNNYSIIQLECKHYMHRKCLMKRLKLKWTTEDINFNYFKCPVCINMIKFETIKYYSKDEEILGLIEESNELYEKIKNITRNLKEHDVREQLQITQLENFCFYLCKKCSNPFYSGLKECIEDIEIYERPVRLCPDCFDFKSIKGMTNCDLHGRTNIQYKCKFCCNLASHFCFGTTHFCEDCHLEQLKGKYLTSKSKEELPKCNDINLCPLKIQHPPNGEEFGLYCLLCRK